MFLFYRHVPHLQFFILKITFVFSSDPMFHRHVRELHGSRIDSHPRRRRCSRKLSIRFYFCFCQYCSRKISFSASVNFADIRFWFISIPVSVHIVKGRFLFISVSAFVNIDKVRFRFISVSVDYLSRTISETYLTFLGLVSTFVNN